MPPPPDPYHEPSRMPPAPDRDHEPSRMPPTPARDRDASGRARQQRPRDALGRPLPYGATGVEPVSEDPLPPMETIAAARALLAEGRPFSAHEVFEARWKAAAEDERDLWQGLAQICVSLTHAARGNAMGSEALLERGAARLEAYAEVGGTAYGLDVGDIATRARRAQPHWE